MRIAMRLPVEFDRRARVARLAAAALAAVPGSAPAAVGAQDGGTALVSTLDLPAARGAAAIALAPEASLWCLRAGAAGAGTTAAPVVLAPCRPLAPAGAPREWRVVVRGTGPLRHLPSGRCVAARPGDAALALAPCDGSAAQQVTNTVGDELRLAAPDGTPQCATVGTTAGTTAPRVGAPLVLAPCRARDARQAFYRTH